MRETPIRSSAYSTGYHTGCPGADDAPLQPIADTNDPDYLAGLADGQIAFNSLKAHYPHLINADGIIRVDEE